MLKTLKHNNQTIFITYRDDSDLSVIDEFFVDKMYRSIDNIIPNLKNPILDIGAHIGIFSIYASILNPKVKIIALEPEPENYKLLKQNLKQNHCKNVLTKQVAITHTNETVIDLFLSQDTHTHSTIKPINQSTNKLQVPATTLEKLIIQNKLEKIGLLKMDIEGAEFEIIRNMEQETWNKIQYLVIEYHPAPQWVQGRPEHYLSEIIRSHGFSIEHFPNHFDKRFGLLLCRDKKTG